MYPSADQSGRPPLSWADILFMGRQAVPRGLAQDAPLIAPTLPSDFPPIHPFVEAVKPFGVALRTFDDALRSSNALEKLRKPRGLVSAEYVLSVDGRIWPSTIAATDGTGDRLSRPGGEVFDACEHGWTSGVRPQSARHGVP